jgi:hypothetical protein
MLLQLIKLCHNFCRDDFPDEQIPTLEDAITTCLDLDLQMFIDVKKFVGVSQVLSQVISVITYFKKGSVYFFF